jgi:hypothetical protein
MDIFMHIRKDRATGFWVAIAHGGIADGALGSPVEYLDEEEFVTALERAKIDSARYKVPIDVAKTYEGTNLAITEEEARALYLCDENPD